jgi:uncharacterized protein YndB with AHSA1/START domain
MFEKIEISALVNSNIEKVWNYYNSPNHIVNWNFASDDWHCPKAESDFVVGGTFTSTMAAKNGEFQFDFGGKYTNIIENQIVSYIMEDNRTVSISFEETEKSVNVTVVFDAETENSIDLQKAGWQAILNNFKTYTENN